MAGAMVGEALISASVEIILDRIASSEFRDFFANRKLNLSLLDELDTKLLALTAVLNDAEEKQITNHKVKEWLDKLKDAVFDGEDLLDEINTDFLKCKLEGDTKNFATRVTSFFPTPFNQLYRRMNSKLEAVSRKLEYFVNQKDILGLQSVSRRGSHRTITSSVVNESDVVAREDDKEKLLKLLLSDDEATPNSIGVITISGMGGLGKTTLAQLLYNDENVPKHFDLKGWACVSDDFDVFRVTKNIYESVTSDHHPGDNLDVLHDKLKNIFKEKKILLVLDDLWNENYNDWDQLITPFNIGKRGSKIIVTTRNETVAKFTHTLSVYNLETLPDENCWRILAKHALCNEGCDKYPFLEEIGRKIARKCCGLPLAAKTLGGLLRQCSKSDAEEWKGILESNIWDSSDKNVLPALRISYLHLPAHLKRCFTYCSIFPKQHSLDRKELILLWKAEGFLQQFHGKETMEVAADNCFNELLSRSLIQNRSVGPKEKFVMHDLIYDLARLESEKICCCCEVKEIPKTVRHLSFLREEYDSPENFKSFYELKCLRTFLPQSHYPWRCDIDKKVPDDLLPILRCLRVLSLSGYKQITELPNSISNLVHLRYLDLSYTSIKSLPKETFRLDNLQTLKLSSCKLLIQLPGEIGNLFNLRYLDLSYTSIKSLPKETFRLYNLQTLKLSSCKLLIQLPGEIGNLFNLRYLDVSGTNLVEMPIQISKLQKLRVLSDFVVGRQEGGLSIRELGNFPYLQGKLSICKLQNVDDTVYASEANIKNKEQIEELALAWDSDVQDSQIAKDVLDKLQPSTDLRKLEIKCYSGTSFPNWIGDSSFSNIKYLHLKNCNYCFSLPPFGQLPSLEELFITGMKMV